MSDISTTDTSSYDNLRMRDAINVRTGTIRALVGQYTEYVMTTESTQSEQIAKVKQAIANMINADLYNTADKADLEAYAIRKITSPVDIKARLLADIANGVNGTDIVANESITSGHVCPATTLAEAAVARVLPQVEGCFDPAFISKLK